MRRQARTVFCADGGDEGREKPTVVGGDSDDLLPPGVHPEALLGDDSVDLVHFGEERGGRGKEAGGGEGGELSEGAVEEGLREGERRRRKGGGSGEERAGEQRGGGKRHHRRLVGRLKGDADARLEELEFEE